MVPKHHKPFIIVLHLATSATLLALHTQFCVKKAVLICRLPEHKLWYMIGAVHLRRAHLYTIHIAWSPNQFHAHRCTKARM